MVETYLIPAMRAIVSDAWRTLAALPDPDSRFMGASKNGIWSQAIKEASGYGYGTATVRITPSARQIARMWEVMGWMTWVRQEYCGQENLRMLQALAFDVPIVTLAAQYNCAERTIRRRRDDILRSILLKFYCIVQEAPPEVMDGAEVLIRYSRTEFTLTASSEPVEANKVWLGGIGWFFRGRPWNDGQAKARKMEAA